MKNLLDSLSLAISPRQDWISLTGWRGCDQGPEPGPTGSTQSSGLERTPLLLKTRMISKGVEMWRLPVFKWSWPGFPFFFNSLNVFNFLMWSTTPIQTNTQNINAYKGWIIARWTHTCNPLQVLQVKKSTPAPQKLPHALIISLPSRGDLIPWFLTRQSVLAFRESLYGIVE